LVSACLVGFNCTYKGRNKENSFLLEQLKKGELIPVCPEQLGGQCTPRPKAEICGGIGADVLKGRAKVIEEDGNDVTDVFLRGAYEVLNIAKSLNVKGAILKERSPSCGIRNIYDGSFSKKLIEGSGVTAYILKEFGIEVKSDEEI
jgi:uncharacterized protein YbbK (DUF523 family)